MNDTQSTNPDTEYEKLTQEIYQALHAAEGFDTIKVEHNVRLEGRSGCKHQIDVYWEFKIVGEVHRVAIECKNYTKEVSIGKVRDFFGVLYDIGNIKGIFVTKKGYQSGAIDFADYYGITLKEMRFPTDKDWEGRLKTIVINITAFIQDIKKREPIIDTDWLLKNGKAVKGQELKVSIFGWTNQLIVYDSKGNPITDFHQMDSKLPHQWKAEKGLEHTYTFDDGYIDTTELGRIKLSGVKYSYDVVSTTTQAISEGEEIVKAILRDVKGGGIKFIDKYGNVK